MRAGGLLLLMAAACAAQERAVIVIGYDGLSPDGLRKAKVPHIDKLREAGAWTYRARGVMPTVSSPNWASMIMGAGPEQHGVTTNDWMPDKYPFPPVCTGPGGIFPTVFGLLREQRPAAKIGIFHDWGGFGRLVEKGVANRLENPKGPQETVRRALEYLKEASPALLFIHLDHVDHAGHEKGHGTREYYASVEEADRLTGEIVRAAPAGTVFLLTSDHGGVGKKHGGETLAELEIPWILSGAGVKRGELSIPVSTVDTAATVAQLLGLQPHPCWTGRAVREALASR
ncbi:MAG: alkaline phosphatase [Bryobacteraceae bacterium]|nr:alkaline phosphatase [Bryobacteraceae bacterium]